MEVCFVDVGQGSCNLILLGNQQAIVLDGGAGRGNIVLDVLRHFKIDSIPRLIISHSHDDHSRGATPLLTEFRGRIGEVWMLEDNRRSRSHFWDRVEEELEGNHLRRQQIRILVRETRPKPVYRDDNITLSLIAPDPVSNFEAIDEQNPNLTSAVLILKRDRKQVIFAADSTIAEWRGVMERRKKPFRCGVVTIPHHGGAVWDRTGIPQDEIERNAVIQSELDWFYSQAVRADFGIISVGSNNRYGHPRPEVMSALLRANVQPLCTQMTAQCTQDSQTELEQQRKRSLPLVLPERSSRQPLQSKSGNSRDVPCAGTILVELTQEGLEIRRFQDLQDMISRLETDFNGTPLCRPRSVQVPETPLTQ